MALRRTVLWILRVLAASILAGVVGGYLLLESHIFREYLTRTAVQQLNKLTGARAEIGNLELRLWTLTANLHNLVLYGKKDPNQPPLVRLDKLTVRLDIGSLLHRKVILDELLVIHPVVHTLADPEGGNNILQWLANSTSKHPNTLDLSIRHLLISQGEINYQDKKTPLTADLYDLGAEIHFDPHSNRYDSWISYHNGRLQCLNYASLRHSLIAKFNATPSHISLESARATVGSSTVFIRGDMDDFTNPRVDSDYNIRIHPQDFGTRSSVVTAVGDILLSGEIHYRGTRRQPFLRNLSAFGQLSSTAITASAADAFLEIRNLHARYQLANGTLQARDVNADLLGGEAIGKIDIQHVDTTPAYQIALSLRGLSLQAIQQAIRGTDHKRLTLQGTLDGTADASWHGTVSNFISHCGLRFHATANSTTRYSEAAIPVEGTVNAGYDRSRNLVTFQATTLHISSMSLAVQGEAGDRSNLQVHAVAADLHQLALLFSSVRPDKASLTGISGSAELKATMQGPMQKPNVAGQLTAHNLVLRDSRWSSARIAARVSPSEFVLDSATLANANQGKVLLNGSVGLHGWSYLPGNPISVNLSVQRTRIADLQGMANLHYPASGELSGDIYLHGSELDPIGSGTIRVLNARIYDEPVQNLMLEFRANNGSVNSTVNIGLPAGSAMIDLGYAPPTKAFSLRLNVQSVDLQALHAVRVRNLPLSGVVKASATGQGTLNDPQLTAILELPKAQFRRNSISQLRAEVRTVNHRADLQLSSRIADAPVQVHGHVNLTGDYYSEAVIDTGALQLDDLLDIYLPGSRETFQARTEFHAMVKGPLREMAQVEAHITIPTLSARYKSFEIGTADPIRVDYAHSVVSLRPAEFRGPGTSVRVQGSLPLGGGSALNFNAQGSVDAGLLRIINPDMRSSGVLSFDVRATGSVSSPSVQGQLQVREFALSTATAPLALENLHGSIDIENNRVRISSLSGQVEGGELSMAGSILYWPNLQFDVKLQTKAVRLRYPRGLRMLLDSNVALTGKSNACTLNGLVLIDDLSFTPDFDLAKLSEHLGRSTVARQAGFANSVKLAVLVQSKNQLSATSSLASVEGNLNLRVIGTAANPVIVGRTDLTSGEVFYRSTRYQFERGVVVFDDPNETRPRLDVSVTTTVQQYNLTLTLRGYLDRLSASYASEPPLATADIINLIAVGTTTQVPGATGRSTDTILASQVAGPVSTKMQSLTGISSLRIDPLVGGSNRDPSARIAIQQRVTKNFIFTFSTDVSQPGGETVEGKYQINKRWSIGAARDPAGGTAVEGRYHTKF